MRKTYTDFRKWQARAEKLGWVHVHDSLIVCDSEDDICVGEFDEGSGSGWIDQNGERG